MNSSNSSNSSVDFTKKLNDKEMQARGKIALALDGFYDLEELRARVIELYPYIKYFKVGLETFIRFGERAVKVVKDSGGEVFLDLKLHDIPNTVERASRAAAEIGVSLFTIHAAGGVEMMRAARIGARDRSQIVAVTVLTSLNDQILDRDLNIKATVIDQVTHLAKAAVASEAVDGIVLSAQEIPLIKKDMPPKFLYVTPGIRGVTSEAGVDQRRTITAREATHNGSSIMVIGRPINLKKSKEERMKEAYLIVKEIAHAI
ncbi:MAG: orotidine-5'-phosphate decarboxylase [Oligoflexia bacterium]|nr:orotidine-5'-phosphate decarboxylase [Oligoflexia bacterium]